MKIYHFNPQDFKAKIGKFKTKTGNFKATTGKVLQNSLCFLGVCLLVSGCVFLNPEAVNEHENTLSPNTKKPITRDQIIGQREHPKILKEFGGVYRYAKAEEKLAVMVGKLMQASNTPSQSYDFTILNSPSVNAFALPGGYVYVTRGLLALANDTAEVAAVIAHEMAHVELRHATQRRKHQTSLIINDIIERMTSSDYDPKSSLQATERLAAFTQRHELEADQVGIRTIGKAGYDPFAAQRFLNVMGRYSKLQRKLEHRSNREFLTTHPSTPQRMKLATHKAREFGAPGIGIKDHEAFLKAIDGIAFGRDPKNGALYGRVYVHTANQIRFTAPDGFELIEKDNFVQGLHKNGTAMRFDIKLNTKSASPKNILSQHSLQGLNKSTISEFNLNGWQGAMADASVKGWQFRIIVFSTKEHIYQFLFTHQNPNKQFYQTIHDTYRSFSSLSAQEAQAIQPKRIHIIIAKKGDTFESLANRMGSIPMRAEHFAILNHIQIGDKPKAGKIYKIVR